jgi:arylsulfatase A-like enzyme
VLFSRRGFEEDRIIVLEGRLCSTAIVYDIRGMAILSRLANAKRTHSELQLLVSPPCLPKKKMNRATYLVFILACLGPFSQKAVRAEPQPVSKPNMIVIVADDLGWGDVGWHGSEIATPNLDRLAMAGARLESFYVQPVCSPTRAALMTGRYPIRHGLQVGVIRPWAQYGLPLEEQLLPQGLKAAGYKTAIVGKWHLGSFERAYLPTQRGFDHQYGHYNGAIDYVTHVRDGGFDWHRDDKVCRDEGYSTHLIADESVRIIDRYAGKEPFFLYVPFNAVHSPHQVPDKYMEKYGHLNGDRKIYAGMLTAMDEAVGKIASAVEQAGVKDNTLFIFSSDNGGPAPGKVTSNGKLRAGKGTHYEGGVRVAAFATWPGKIPAGSMVQEPMHIADLYPTLLRLADSKVQQKLPLDGLDAWETISQGKPSPHQEILINATPVSGAIRVGKWKLVVNGAQASQGFDGESEDKPTKNKIADNTSNEKTELFD